LTYRSHFNKESLFADEDYQSIQNNIILEYSNKRQTAFLILNVVSKLNANSFEGTVENIMEKFSPLRISEGFHLGGLPFAFSENCSIQIYVSYIIIKSHNNAFNISLSEILTIFNFNDKELITYLVMQTTESMPMICLINGLKKWMKEHILTTILRLK